MQVGWVSTSGTTCRKRKKRLCDNTSAATLVSLGWVHAACISNCCAVLWRKIGNIIGAWVFCPHHGLCLLLSLLPCCHTDILLASPPISPYCNRRQNLPWIFLIILLLWLAMPVPCPPTSYFLSQHLPQPFDPDASVSNGMCCWRHLDINDIPFHCSRSEQVFIK